MHFHLTWVFILSGPAFYVYENIITSFIGFCICKVSNWFTKNYKMQFIHSVSYGYIYERGHQRGNLGYCFLVLATFLLRQSLTGMEHTRQVRLYGQRAPGSFLSSLSSFVATRTCHYAQGFPGFFFFVAYRDWNEVLMFIRQVLTVWAIFSTHKM